MPSSVTQLVSQRLKLLLGRLGGRGGMCASTLGPSSSASAPLSSVLQSSAPQSIAYTMVDGPAGIDKAAALLDALPKNAVFAIDCEGPLLWWQLVMFPFTATFLLGKTFHLK